MKIFRWVLAGILFGTVVTVVPTTKRSSALIGISSTPALADEDADYEAEQARQRAQDEEEQERYRQEQEEQRRQAEQEQREYQQEQEEQRHQEEMERLKSEQSE